MLSRSQLKEIRLLHQKKYREEKKLFIAEGRKVVSELIQEGFRVKNIFASADYNGEGKNKAAIVSEKELEQLSVLSTPNKVIAIFQIPERMFEGNWKENILSLA